MARKLFITVHGIGDQRQFDSVQRVASQVLRVDSKNKYGPRLSLGKFASGAVAKATSHATATAVHWHSPKTRILGFSEVHWADLCRKPEREGFRLEPVVPWAQTLVDHVSMLKADSGNDQEEKAHEDKTDFELIRAIIGEMGDGLHLIGWLTKLAPHLQLPTFEVDDIVNQYLGDVQFVAEFSDIREQILERFAETMEGVFQNAKLQDGDEIYLISHSEGTVVTLLGLLRAMRPQQKGNEPPSQAALKLATDAMGSQNNGNDPLKENEPPAWLKHVRGWMTIGSPIDKHLILWPDLFQDFEPGPNPKHLPPEPIPWWNYADRGDPVGFERNSMRSWMKDHKWANNDSGKNAFQFGAESTAKDNDGNNENAKEIAFECVFSRYPWPGQAHLDYWNDNDLFDHFLCGVAGIGESSQQEHYRQLAAPVLKDKWIPQFTSYAVPYLMAFFVLMMGVYFFDAGVWAALGLKNENDLTHFRTCPRTIS